MSPGCSYPSQAYPAEFRQQMVELVRAGRKPSELAKEFGVHSTNILKWARLSSAIPGQLGGKSTADAPLSANERQKLIELRRQFHQVQLERDILAKATACWQTTAWFQHGRESDGALAQGV